MGGGVSGKGSARRPTAIGTAEWERRWAIAFGRVQGQETCPHEPPAAEDGDGAPDDEARG